MGREEWWKVTYQIDIIVHAICKWTTLSLLPYLYTYRIRQGWYAMHVYGSCIEDYLSLGAALEVNARKNLHWELSCLGKHSSKHLSVGRLSIPQNCGEIGCCGGVHVLCSIRLHLSPLLVLLIEMPLHRCICGWRQFSVIVL